MKPRFVVIPIVLIAAAGAAVYALRGGNRQPENRILLSGNIELTEVDIAFKTSGRLVELSIAEGDRVTRGQVVARLDREQLIAQREREAATLASAEAQVAQAKTALEWQKETLAGDIQQRKADLASNEARLAELQNGARPQEKQEARAAVEAAQAEFDRSQKDWDRAQTLLKNDDISRQQYDQYRSRRDTADANLRQTKEREALVLAGARREQVEAQAGQVERSRAALRTSEANNLETRRRREEITARQADIGRSKAAIALIDSQLADTIGASPVSGVVLLKSAELGEVVAPGVAIARIGDVEHPWVRAYINETELGKVKIGSRARVTSDSFQGKSYDGRVSFISSEAEFTPKQIQTKQERVKLVYRIKIDVDNPHGELKSNMPVDAEIPLGQ